MKFKLYCEKCNADLKHVEAIINGLIGFLSEENRDIDGRRTYRFDVSEWVCECPFDDEIAAHWVLRDIESGIDLLSPLEKKEKWDAIRQDHHN